MATRRTVGGRPWVYDRSAWNDTCVYIISRNAGGAPLAAMQAQLLDLRLPAATRWPGVEMGDEWRGAPPPALPALIRRLLNEGYLHDGSSAEVRRLSAGLTGTMLAHLGLWRHTLDEDAGRCTYTMIFVRRDLAETWPRYGRPNHHTSCHDQEDDAAFLPHFGEWARWQMARAGDFDFINLAAIRAWGSESPGVECAQSCYLHATIPDGDMISLIHSRAIIPVADSTIVMMLMVLIPTTNFIHLP